MPHDGRVPDRAEESTATEVALNPARRRLSAVTLVTALIVSHLVAWRFVYVRPRAFAAARKTAEARAMVDELAKRAAAAYTRDGALCGSALAAVPSDPARIRGRSYVSSPLDWRQDPRGHGFGCLGFSITTPQRFMYRYASAIGDSGDEEFTVIAQGDLDGDGQFSTFSLSGRVRDGIVQIAPVLVESDPTE